MSRALCFQGGGVFVESGTVSFSSCTITGNSARNVRAHVQNFPSPPWEFLTDMQFDSRRSIGIKSCVGKMLTRLPRLTLAQLRPTLRQLQDVRAAETLQSSHRPDGKMPC